MIKGIRYSKGFMANNNILPEFQVFLRSRKLVPEKNIPYFACWASKFLAFARNRAVSYKRLVLSC
jgi:hypothetical protein